MVLWIGALLSFPIASPSDAPEVEAFRLCRAAMGQLFGQIIHVVRNGEVVTADASWASWGFLFGGRAKREEVFRRLREWLPPRIGTLELDLSTEW